MEYKMYKLMGTLTWVLMGTLWVLMGTVYDGYLGTLPYIKK